MSSQSQGAFQYWSSGKPLEALTEVGVGEDFASLEELITANTGAGGLLLYNNKVVNEKATGKRYIWSATQAKFLPVEVLSGIVNFEPPKPLKNIYGDRYAKVFDVEINRSEKQISAITLLLRFVDTCDITFRMFNHENQLLLTETLISGAASNFYNKHIFTLEDIDANGNLILEFKSTGIVLLKQVII